MPSQEYAIMITAHQRAELLPIDREDRPIDTNEVCGRTLSTLISPGTEINSAYLSTEGFPRAVGYAAIFRVEEIGSAVKDINLGQLVFCMGNHRSYQRTSRNVVIPVPEGLKPEIAVFARLMCVSMTTLTTTTARPPEKVLVIGQGIVGNLAAQIFKKCGYEVIACEPDETRRKISMECGISNVFPSVPADNQELIGKISLALDCSGHEQAVLDACNLLRKRGELVLIATPWKRYTDIYAHSLMHAVFHKYVVMRSGWEWELPLHETEFRTNSIFGNLKSALNWLANGEIRVDPLSARISPREAQQAYQNLVHKRTKNLTYVFDWQQL